MEAIEKHIQKYAGKIHLVFHEIVSPDIHLDIYWVKTKMYSRKVNVLITSGMSEKKMTTPEGMEDFQYAELCLILPDDWKLAKEDFQNEENYWPVRLLKDLGRFPHDNNTWLGMEHTIENDDQKPYSSNILFTGSLIFVPMGLSQKFYLLKHGDKKINFYSVIPLYQEEVDLKIQHGSDALLNNFDEYGINDVLDINRKNVAL